MKLKFHKIGQVVRGSISITQIHLPSYQVTISLSRLSSILYKHSLGATFTKKFVQVRFNTIIKRLNLSPWPGRKKKKKSLSAKGFVEANHQCVPLLLSLCPHQDGNIALQFIARFFGIRSTIAIKVSQSPLKAYRCGHTFRRCCGPHLQQLMINLIQKWLVLKIRAMMVQHVMS